MGSLNEKGPLHGCAVSLGWGSAYRRAAPSDGGTGGDAVFSGWSGCRVIAQQNLIRPPADESAKTGRGRQMSRCASCAGTAGVPIGTGRRGDGLKWARRFTESS